MSDLIERLRDAYPETIAFTNIKHIGHEAADALATANERIRELEGELKHEEQRIADLMADVNRQGHELNAEHAVSDRLRAALTEARRWIGDGEFSDGLNDCYWTPEYRAAVAMVDAALKVPNA